MDDIRELLKTHTPEEVADIIQQRIEEKAQIRKEQSLKVGQLVNISSMV